MIMYGYRLEKMAVGHYWDLKGQSYSIEDDIKRIPYQTTGHKKNFVMTVLQPLHQNLKKLAQIFDFSIHVHPYHLLQKKTSNSFSA